MAGLAAMPCLRRGPATRKVWQALVLLSLLCGMGADTAPPARPTRPMEKDYPVADPESCGGFEELLDFVKGHGGVASGLGIRLAMHEDREVRIMSAATHLIPGQIVVRVPTNLTMNLETAARHSEALKVVLNAPKERCGNTLLPQRSLFVLLVLHEALDAASFWRPYICTLPRIVDVPLAWPDDLLKDVLENPLSPESRLFNASDKEKVWEGAQRHRDHMWKHYDAVVEHIVRRNPDLFPPHKYTPEAWRWAWSIMQTRSWEDSPPDWLTEVVSDGGKDMDVMVPLGDMFDHRKGEAPLDIDVDEGTWDIYVGNAVGEGDEIFIDYGKGLTNLDLMLTFGFADPTLAEGYTPPALDAPEGQAK